MLTDSVLTQGMLDTLRNSKRVAIQEAGDILDSGCMTDKKIANLYFATGIVLHVCKLESMHVIEESVVPTMMTRKVVHQTPVKTTCTSEAMTTGTMIN